jgi:RHS repeat-associated protein
MMNSPFILPQKTLKNTPPRPWVGIRNISDYSPFGVLLKERTVESAFFRRGFNGMEADQEVKGKGSSYSTEFRQYDPRIGRWLSLDPEFANFPWQSPYVAFDNNPIVNTDPKGRAAERQTNNPERRRQKLTVKRSNELLKNGQSKKWHRIDNKITRLNTLILGGETGVNTPKLANYGKGDGDQGDKGVGGPTEEYEIVTENFAYNRLGFKAARMDPSGNVDVIDVGVVDPANPLVPVWPTGNPYGETPGDPVVSDVSGNILSSTGTILIPSLKEVSPHDGLYQAGDVKSDGTIAATDEIVRKEVMIRRDASGVVMAKDLGKERTRDINKKVESSN